MELGRTAVDPAPAVCSIIARIQHPMFGPEDVPIWVHSADGHFSIRSAYEVLFEDMDGSLAAAFPFDIIWKLRSPLVCRTSYGK